MAAKQKPAARHKAAATASAFDSERFALFIKASRRVRDLSQDDLADRAGISKQAVSNLETGRGGPSVETLCLLAKALELTPAQVLDGGLDGSVPPKSSELERVMELFSRFDAREAKEAVKILESVDSFRPRSTAVKR